jgi:hypothetical protein
MVLDEPEAPPMKPLPEFPNNAFKPVLIALVNNSCIVDDCELIYYKKRKLVARKNMKLVIL